MTAQPTLFDGAARATDPATSHTAASKQRGGVRPLILRAFSEWGALCDDELTDLLDDWYPPTVKTARSRLANEGLLMATGETRPSHRGCEQQVYDLAVRCRRVETVHDAKGRVA